MAKIGIVVINFPVTSETFILTKVIGLIENNYDIYIFSSNKSKNWENFLSNKDIIDKIKKKIILSPFAYKKNIFKFIIKSVKLILEKFILYPKLFIYTFMSEYNFHKTHGTSFLNNFLYKLTFIGYTLDILHIEFDFQAFGLMNLKHICGAKLILSGRGSIDRTSMPYRYKNFYHEIFSKVDYYHFISHYLYKEAVKNGLSEKVPWKLIEPAIDLKLFVPNRTKKSDSRIIITTVARLSWEKGYEFMMDAIAKVYKKYKNITYKVIGHGNYYEAIWYAAFQNGLINEKVVEFIGSIPRIKVQEYLNASDIFILASLDEGFCNAVIEAQALELPVVCSDAGGLPENIENEVTGFVVPRRDSDALAEKIIYLIENPDVRITMGKAGRKRALEKYDLEKQKKMFIEMYQEALNS